MRSSSTLSSKGQMIIPQLLARPALVGEAGYRICLGRGSRDLQVIEPLRARDKVMRAVQYKPYALAAMPFLGANSLPASCIRGLKSAAKWLGGLGRHRAGAKEVTKS